MQRSLLSWLRPGNTDSNNPENDNESTGPVKQNSSKEHHAAAGRIGDHPPDSRDEAAAQLSFKPPFGPLHKLSSSARIVPFVDKYTQAFKRLNAVMLPVPYPDKFYKEILEDEIAGDITRVAIWKDQAGKRAAEDEGELVAGIRCRLLSSVPGIELPSAPILYISTIGTLAPYRTHSLATHLLADVAMTALNKYGASTIVAHTWEANEDGIEWYRRRGFRVIKREENYYRRLHPRTAALVMAKDLLPSDLTGSGAGGSSPKERNRQSLSL